jgi:hypothetical protein
MKTHLKAWVGFRPWYRIDRSGQSTLGWVEERNPTEGRRVSNQPFHPAHQLKGGRHAALQHIF